MAGRVAQQAGGPQVKHPIGRDVEPVQVRYLFLERSEQPLAKAPRAGGGWVREHGAALLRRAGDRPLIPDLDIAAAGDQHTSPRGRALLRRGEIHRPAVRAGEARGGRTSERRPGYRGNFADCWTSA
jgi:hypothetical protein